MTTAPWSSLLTRATPPPSTATKTEALYGTGFPRLNDSTGRVERVGGIRYTIKDGIVYDARKLLADVAAMVEKQKKERAATSANR